MIIRRPNPRVKHDEATRISVGDVIDSAQVRVVEIAGPAEFRAYAAGRDGTSYFTPATFTGNRRRADRAEFAGLVCLDFDELTPAEAAAIEHALPQLGIACAWHATRSSTAERPRRHLIAWLGRRVAASEYARACDSLAKAISRLVGFALVCDPACRKVSQPIFFPPPGAAVSIVDGRGFIPPPKVTVDFSQLGPALVDDGIVAALKKATLYLRDAGDGKHLVRCPWEARHTPNGDGGRSTSSSEAAYFAPGARVGERRLDGGMYKCLHAHCADRRLRDLREFLGLGAAAARAETAGEPTPLVREMPPPDPYPIDSLGPILVPAARAIAEIVQVPDAMAANTVLAAAALAAQPHANVQTLGGDRPVSLYILTIAQSGDRKTAADSAALSSVGEYVRRLMAAYETQRADWEHRQEAVKLDRSRARDAATSGDAFAQALGEMAAPPPPRRPWLICSEPTAEGLMRSLAEGQYGQGIYSDEGGQFIGGHALSEDAELRTVSMLSRAWQGAPLDRVRATDHEHLTLYGRRLSIHLLVQPMVASRLLGKPLYREQGWLARWLMCAPDSLAGTRIHDPGVAAITDDPRMKRFYDAIDRLLEAPAIEDRNVGGLDPPTLQLSSDARRLLVATYNEIEKGQGENGAYETVREWAAKAAEHACRIAGVLTLIGDPVAAEVTGETMRGALTLMRYYFGEYTRLIGAADVPERIRHAQALVEWMRHTSRTTVTRREVMRGGPQSIRSADTAKVAIAVLVEHGHLVTADDRVYTLRTEKD